MRTGVLDSLDNDDFETAVKEHGGRVVHAVSSICITMIYKTRGLINDF